MKAARVMGGFLDGIGDLDFMFVPECVLLANIEVQQCIREQLLHHTALDYRPTPFVPLL